MIVRAAVSFLAIALGLGACATSQSPVPVTAPAQQTPSFQLNDTVDNGGLGATSGLSEPYSEPQSEPKSEPKGAFADWAGVVIAADKTGSGGGPTQAFDNARRDLTDAFIKAGFDGDNLAQFSAAGLDDDALDLPTADGVKAVLNRLIGRAGDGCLIYVTSHGDETGIVFGSRKLTPEGFAGILSGSCGMRPTVAIVSACYSGVFVEPLAAPNRLIVTAARPDRNSFGCGEGNQYPYYDACVLETIGRSQTFLELADLAEACVAQKEASEQLLASEPQKSIGSSVGPVLNSLKFHQQSE